MKVGDIFTTNNSGDLVVLELTPKKAYVQFVKTGYEKWCDRGCVKSGKVNDPYHPDYSGVGFFGEGDYHVRDKSGKTSSAYTRWMRMIARCYDEQSPDYKWYGEQGVQVCEEWFNYQNFAAFYWEGISKLDVRETYNIDKDLLGGTLYSPDTCLLLPQSINKLISISKPASKTGVTGVFLTKNGKYRVQVSNPFTRKCEVVGTFESMDKAMAAYEKAKSDIVKQVAKEAYNQRAICHKAYLALLNWKP